MIKAIIVFYPHMIYEISKLFPFTGNSVQHEMSRILAKRSVRTALTLGICQSPICGIYQIKITVPTLKFHLCTRT